MTAETLEDTVCKIASGEGYLFAPGACMRFIFHVFDEFMKTETLYYCSLSLLNSKAVCNPEISQINVQLQDERK